MTQDVLSSMSSDEVNSISDTAESLQVATIIRQKYFDIVNRLGLPRNHQLVQLEASDDNTKPTLMYVPDGVSDIAWVKYFDNNPQDGNSSDDFAHDLNVDLTTLTNAGVAPPGYLYVTVLPNDEFLDMVGAFSKDDTDVFSYQLSDNSNGFNGNFTINYKNDQQPTYCTVVSNYYVLFDSYDSSIDSTLQSSKTMCFAGIIPDFQLVDTFIPDLEEEQFPLLLNEAKSLAWVELKQQAHPLAAQETRRGWTAIQQKKAVINRPTYFDELPGFGRKRGYYGFRGGTYVGMNQYNARGGLY